MGVSPGIWGPSAWALIHLLPLSEPDQFTPTHYQAFFDSLIHVLPCEACRKHLQENLAQLPTITTLTTKKQLFDWTVQLHNKVNQLTNKPIWTTAQAYAFWKGVADGKNKLHGGICLPNYWKYATYILVLLLISITFSWSRQPRKK